MANQIRGGITQNQDQNDPSNDRIQQNQQGRQVDNTGLLPNQASRRVPNDNMLMNQSQRGIQGGIHQNKEENVQGGDAIQQPGSGRRNGPSGQGFA